jgi:hypothetical protein
MTEPIRRRWPGIRARPVNIDIRNNASQSIDPNEPSFLTTLPAELRNEVYKWLFHRDEPIIYTGSWIQQREPEFVERYLDSDDEDDSNSTEDKPTHEELALLRKPPHDIGPVVGVLRTCRQVYHEAVGVLYSSNSFTISADLHRHNSTMKQIYRAAQFIDWLGSQTALLKKVNIDIDPTCPSGCWQLSDEYD